MVTFNPNIICIKKVFTSNLSFINPWNVYWFTLQQQTVSLDTKKFGYIHTKFFVEENDPTLPSKTHTEWLKSFKIQAIFEKRVYTLFAV